MNSKPFFSIITISYNQSQFLSKCLDSVAYQDFESYEHIVVDPGSNDSSRNIITSYPSSHIIPIFKKDSGPSEGLNNGILEASGSYILFINSDDYFCDGALSLVYQQLTLAAFPDIMFFGGYKEKSDLSSVSRVFPGSIFGGIHASGLSVFFQQGTIIKSEMLECVGAFNISNRTCWDSELFLKILSQRDVNAKRRSFPIAYFVIHPMSITSNLADTTKSKSLKLRKLNDSRSYVLRYYGSFFLIIRQLVCKLPRPLFIMLKYSLDPIFAFWTISFIARKGKDAQ